MCHFSEQEFAKRLLEIFHECRASAVVITRLAFQDFFFILVKDHASAFESFSIEGSWDSWEDRLGFRVQGGGIAFKQVDLCTVISYKLQVISYKLSLRAIGIHGEMV